MIQECKSCAFQFWSKKKKSAAPHEKKVYSISQSRVCIVTNSSSSATLLNSNPSSPNNSGPVYIYNTRVFSRSPSLLLYPTKKKPPKFPPLPLAVGQCTIAASLSRAPIAWQRKSAARRRRRRRRRWPFNAGCSGPFIPHCSRSRQSSGSLPVERSSLSRRERVYIYIYECIVGPRETSGLGV